ncbi:FGGY-family carbohydrate kinase [Streptomyces sp. S.PB5]|uniref:FGGY-family carbohydrate kinase n=1 Tax=Streptomyces sp. S.PB5 TaxID=3020844 RepID=UPI0025B05314|nr:FGGY-family carbohydrate kinase [Streptomyces sp. S.PB5]MDN3022880.1 FGGY-family carbohydrate kinase [Streptomyces sp. S.PB5]
MAQEAWLGIDLGTQSVRALVVSADGRVLGSGTAPLSGRREGPRHEQDPGQWWTAVCTASRAAVGDGSPHIGGLAVCGTSGTVLLTDPDGRPVSPALMYDDGRAWAEAERLRAAGLAVQNTWGLPKAAWLLREHGGGRDTKRRRSAADADRAPGDEEAASAGRTPGRPSAASDGGSPGPAEPPRAPDAGGRSPGRDLRLAHQPDVITARLVGHPVPTDSSHALKTAYDAEAEAWPDGPGVPPAVLPDVVRPGTRLGEVCAAAAEATGVPAGTPVIAGMTDGCAAQIASGALRAGSWNSVLGTTLVLKGASPVPVHDPTGVVYNHRAPDGSWLPGGASSVGAGVLTAAFAGADPAAMDERAAAHEPSGAIAYPLVSPGERFPFLAPGATALLLGEPEGEADLWAALLQGVAFAERLCLDYLHHLGAPLDGPLTFTGGGARSPYWNQLRADVLGRPARVPEQTEPALGMAALAAHGVTGEALPDIAGRMVRVRTVVEPRPGRTRAFAEPYARLVDELTTRGWLPPPVAAHAHSRLTLDTADS